MTIALRLTRAELTKTFVQLVKMTIVSVIINIAGYVLYLALVYAGLDPKVSVTICYALAVLSSFTFNRRWTFRHADSVTAAMRRYAAIYVGAYAFNISSLYVCVDLLGYRHELVQLGVFVIVSTAMYLLQRFWVFAAAPVRQTE